MFHINAKNKFIYSVKTEAAFSSSQADYITKQKQTERKRWSKKTYYYYVDRLDIVCLQSFWILAKLCIRYCPNVCYIKSSIIRYKTQATVDWELFHWMKPTSHCWSPVFKLSKKAFLASHKVLSLEVFFLVYRNEVPRKVAWTPRFITDDNQTVL